MSQSGSGKLDPVLEGVELLFHQKGGSASFGTKVVPSFEWSGSELYELNYWIHL
jgi:hypothetical protein